jgi:hypothetical protein
MGVSIMPICRSKEQQDDKQAIADTLLTKGKNDEANARKQLTDGPLEPNMRREIGERAKGVLQEYEKKSRK